MKKLEYNPLTGEFEMSSSPMVMVSYHELKALRDSGVLEPGCQYRITDYNLVVDDAPSENPARSANHVFDIVVTALSEKDLSEDAKAVRNERDAYFANSNLDAWQIKYCLDNDNSRFAWAYPDKVLGFTANRVFYENIPASDVIYEGEKYLAFVNGEDYLYLKENDLGYLDATLYVYVDDYFSGKIMEPTAITGIAYQKASNPGRGVIYYMKDEFGNEAPYDFKNVMFHISSDEAVSAAGLKIGYHHTFTEILKGGGKADYSLKSNCSNNVIKEYVIDGKLHLNRNIILSSDAYPECHGNFFDRDCRNIVIGCGSENKFGLGCYNINLLGSNRRNIFGTGCNKCLLDLGCENNTIGNDCKISMAKNVENITIANGLVSTGFIDAKPYTYYFRNSYGEVKGTDILTEKHHLTITEVTEDNPVFTLKPSVCYFIKKPVNKLFINLAAENLKDNYTREYELIFNTGSSSDVLPNIFIQSYIKLNKEIEFICDRTYVLRITHHCYGGHDMTIGTIDEYNFKS